MTAEDGTSDAPVSADGPEPDEVELLAAFDRLRPQGGLRWGFDDAMRRLSERGEGTGAAGVPWDGLPDDLWERGRSARIGQRFVGDVAGVLASILAADARNAADAAMDDRLVAAWDALRYLAARLESLESRVDPVGTRLDGPPVAVPEPDVSGWAEEMAEWFGSPDPSGPVIVGESGNGALMTALQQSGHRVRGVEPRGPEVWSSLADPQLQARVVLGEVGEFLATAESRSAAGVVLVGAVDRLDLPAKLGLLADAVRVVARSGTVALLVTDQARWDGSLPTVARDLVPGRPLHPETWLFLLRRFGVVDPTWHRSGDGSMHALVGENGPVSGIHQFVPMLHRHDAVGEHTRAVRQRLEAAGVASRIYTELPDPETVDETRPYLAYPDEAEPGDVLVYQFATESVMARWLAARPEPLVLNYHSATPPEYFIPWNNGIARLQVQSLLELADIAPRADLGVAVSEFDAAELRVAGCAATVVVPVANVAYPPVAPDPATAVRLERQRQARAPGGGRALSSVGRLAPNKGHQDTIAALFVARMTSDPDARLTLIGAPSEPNYAHALRRYANSLGLAEAVDFVSGVDDAQLAAYYRASDVLVMLSEHEGFGVPIIEAMANGIPVVAYAAGAVGEVLGTAGVLLDRKHPRQVASAVHRLLADPTEVERLVAEGRGRVEALDLATAGNRLVAAIRSVSDRVAVSPETGAV